jgi:hypothetical protein
MLVFITLILGPMLPLLYPIALLAIVVQYFTDKIFLTYFFRLPPKHSEKLTLQNIKLMVLAPILSLMVNYWSFGNRQMFENKIDPISTLGEVTYSHHLVTDSTTLPAYTHLKWIWGMLIVYILLILLVVMYRFIDAKTNSKEAKLLPNYFNSLKIQDCEDLIEDENHFRAEGGFSCLNDRAVTQMKQRIESYHENISQIKQKDKDRKRNPSPSRPPSRGSDRVMFKDDLEMRPSSRQSNRGNMDYQYEMIGQPCYQIYRQVDYQLKFNNQNTLDELNTKLLLMMPMVKKSKHESIKLNHLKLYELE